MSIFKDHSRKISDYSVSIMPIDGKVPLIKAWQKLCNELPTDSDIEAWSNKYPNANIGLCLGSASKCIAFDIDTEDPKITLILETLLPKSPSGKRGAKGVTWFYKFTGQDSRVLKYKGQQFADFLSTGRQTVIPPSIHPTSNLPYEWVGTPVYECIDDLPTIDNDIITKILVSINSLEIDVSDKKKFSEGRNDVHKIYVLQKVDKMSENDIALSLVERDSKLFPDHALFLDRSEPICKSDDAFSNAYDFVTNIKKTVLRKKRERGDKVLPSSIDVKYPSMKNGFFSSPTKVGDPEHPEYKELANYMCSELNFKHNDGSDYLYIDAKYESISNAYLRNRILNLTQNKATHNHVGNFLKESQDLCFFDFEANCNMNGLINLKNGILNVDKKELLSHSPNYFFKYKLPHNYDASSSCPKFKEYLLQCLDDQVLVDLVFEIFGYVLEGHGQSKQRAFCFTGPSGTGKSTVLEVLKSLVGESNYSSVELDKLDNDFHCVRLDGKILNVTGELPEKAINASKFKTIIGYEPINVSEKNKPVYSIRVDAKFIFSANGLPSFNSGSNIDALLRRLVFIPFNKKIGEEEMIENYHLKFIDEISGILNEALVGLKRLKERGNFSTSQKTDELSKEFRNSNDSVSDFFNENAVFEQTSVTDKISAKDAYYIYKQYCEDTNRRAVAYKEFVSRSKTYFDDKFSKENIEELPYYYPQNLLHFRYIRLGSFLQKMSLNGASTNNTAYKD